VTYNAFDAKSMMVENEAGGSRSSGRRRAEHWGASLTRTRYGQTSCDTILLGIEDKLGCASLWTPSRAGPYWRTKANK
jgi:hypothetical protein